ncbi:MAG: hypothetical protein K6G03_11185 [Lachnospiraceae bacterium]|nr:hypothetical protein [Lachnospiraceae bacterium]
MKIFLEYAAVCICGCVFVLLSASWVSPIFHDAYGYDSSWYSLMGRAITQGMVPYRDYFDLKGPVFFFIEAIGQAFCHGRNGIFIIECIAASVSCIFIYKTCLLYIKRWQIGIIFIFTAFIALSPFWGGNTCEEYMLPFNFACIFLSLRYLKYRYYEEYAAPAIVFGLSFAVMLLSKVTTCAPMAASALTVLIILIIKREYRHLPGIIAYFLLGFAVVFIPVCFYFYFNHAFKDFIYAAFVFAFKRGTDYYETFSYEWELKIIICYVSFLATLLVPVKRADPEKLYLKIFGLVLSFVTWAALHLGTPYDYYFLLTMPCLIHTMMLIFLYWNYPPIIGENEENVSKKRQWTRKRIRWQTRILWLILLFVIFDHYYPDSKNKIKENIEISKRTEDSYVEECKEVLNYIPVDEWNDIYDLESGMIFYEVNQLLPANRYPVNLPYFMHLNPQIKTNVMYYLDILRPHFIISEQMDAFDDEDVKNYVFGHYVLYEDVGAEEIYVRAD